MRRMRISIGAALALAALASAQAGAAETCALCSRQIVTNPELADCFLEKYTELSARKGAAVAVDLSDCPSDRGIVDPLPTLDGGVDEPPDTSFLLSRTQLGCLKAKLEEPGLKLEPQARIDLGSCG